MARFSSDADQIAAFLAARGATKIAEGTRAYDDKELYKAVRSDQRARTIEDKTEDQLIAERHYVTGSNGVEHCQNGLGEWLY